MNQSLQRKFNNSIRNSNPFCLLWTSQFSDRANSQSWARRHRIQILHWNINLLNIKFLNFLGAVASPKTSDSASHCETDKWFQFYKSCSEFLQHCQCNSGQLKQYKLSYMWKRTNVPRHPRSHDFVFYVSIVTRKYERHSKEMHYKWC